MQYTDFRFHLKKERKAENNIFKSVEGIYEARLHNANIVYFAICDNGTAVKYKNVHIFQMHLMYIKVKSSNIWYLLSNISEEKKKNKERSEGGKVTGEQMTKTEQKS